MCLEPLLVRMLRTTGFAFVVKVLFFLLEPMLCKLMANSWQLMFHFLLVCVLVILANRTIVHSQIVNDFHPYSHSFLHICKIYCTFAP